MKSTIKEAAKFAVKLILSTYNIETKKEGIQQVKQIRRFCKDKIGNIILHGWCIGSVDRQRIGGEDALLWLLKGDCMAGILEVWIDSVLMEKARCYGC